MGWNSIFSDLLTVFSEKQTGADIFSMNKTKPPSVVTTRVCLFGFEISPFQREASKAVFVLYCKMLLRVAPDGLNRAFGS